MLAQLVESKVNSGYAWWLKLWLGFEVMLYFLAQKTWMNFDLTINQDNCRLCMILIAIVYVLTIGNDYMMS